MTISIMGGATFVIGLLPTYEQIGLLAPVILVVLRLLQGLALGGEYGGAAIYVAEHAPDDRRGYFTAYIQTTATLGLLLSLGVIIATERIVGEAAFASWGWRIPFLLSGVLVLMALYIRLSLKETPLFQKLKASGKSSTKPLSDAFRNNAWKLMALALFGATAGQGVVWYTGQFYALFFLADGVGSVAGDIGADRRGGLDPGHAVLLGVRQAVRPDRTKTNHPRGLPAGRGDLRAAVRGDERGVRPAERPGHGAADLHPSDLCDHGLRTDRGFPGGAVSRQGPLHLAVTAVPHRQRGLRRLGAAGVQRHRGGDRQHLRRAIRSLSL